ncbi:MAG TPA: hypothetical protein VFA27_01750 [Vicinamibacterales bacterium]|nr:hypothetical protein [Vicinamibacterales bacterium]
MATLARLPGITFETARPPVVTPLPRMDIAGFVGFARSGPINVPVAIGDVPHFHDIFGEDVALAADPAAGGVAYAELPPAVRAFFRNGGDRCWVVRVAGAGAARNTFLLPGVLAAAADGTSGFGAAIARARSAGSWSDSLDVNLTLSQRPLAAVAVSPPGGGPVQISGVTPGDLVQIDCPALGIVAFQPVPDTGARPPLTVSAPSPDAYWFRRAERADVDLAPSSPPAAITWLAMPLAVRWLGGAVPPALDPPVPIARWGVRDTGFLVEMDRSALGAIEPGTWLRITMAPTTPTLLLRVDGIEAASVDSPPASGDPVWLTASDAWWVLDGATGVAAIAGETLHASIVTLEFWVRDPNLPLQRLSDVGCAAPHPRYWGDVPDDDIVFGPDDRQPTRLDQISTSLLDLVIDPRFPLAATLPNDPQRPPIFLPLGVPGVLQDEFYQGALPIAGDPLTRDGLATFDTRLFIDDGLRLTTARNLITEAFQIQYVDPVRPLTGMHALVPVDEVSMIAVPDAIQRPWHRDVSSTPPLPAPTLVDVAAAGAATHVTWTPLAAADRLAGETIAFDVQSSYQAQFSTVTRQWSTDTTAVDDDTDVSTLCSTPVFYRVRATSTLRGVGPWSNTRWIRLPFDPFQPCQDDLPAAPAPIAAAEAHGRITVSWSDAGAPGAAFTLERASDPAFASATVVYTGPALQCDVLPGAEPVVYFRVAAQVDGSASPWSTTASVGVLQQSTFTVDDPDSYDESALLAIDTALVRLCAGRSDAHAVLGFPSHYREDRASAFVSTLSTALATSDGLRALSYAAAFHPWLLVRETTGRADLSTWTMPPDGSMCGILAARTLLKGAWYSPANQPFVGALALQPPLDADALTLLGDRINPIAQATNGFIAVDAQTLSPDDDLRDLHVRRLLILLRRLALREGSAWVFRNNDDSLRRLVQREFEQVLGDLFIRGAFAGDVHDEGYRIVTDDSVNTANDRDQGRFIVELRVAPSQPLAFLTVRLVQEGSGLMVEGS